VGTSLSVKRRGLQADKHLVTAWNITMKRPMRRPLLLMTKTLGEPLVIERGKDEDL